MGQYRGYAVTYTLYVYVCIYVYMYLCVYAHRCRECIGVLIVIHSPHSHSPSRTSRKTTASLKVAPLGV